jgi:hypothetical protein
MPEHSPGVTAIWPNKEEATNLSQRAIRSDHATKDAAELLDAPVTALLGVSTAAATALAKINIKSVFDLAASGTMHAAALAAGEDLVSHAPAPPRLALDVVDDQHASKQLQDLATQPLAALRAIDDQTGAELQAALAVSSLRDLGLWPPYVAARSILAISNGSAEAGVDGQTPPDLLPAMGRYPTERVQYQVIVLGQILDGRDRDGDTRSAIEGSGPIDVTVGALEGFTRPAVGALLTYTQSWYTAGLALGQLLHSVALAPGESTRVAMIDWSRRTGARSSEAITETEALSAEMTRARALNEVVNAVATESQTGFSQAFGTGVGTETGSGAGAALDLSKIAKFPLSVAAGVTGSFGIGFSTATSFATTNGRRQVDATMSQNITDRTQQAASSVRNRWATVVREVSQQESERISTRALTNFNHMHALTVQYYEVVQLHRTVVELARVERCLFVPMKLVDFRDAATVTRYKGVIAAAGLVPGVQALALADPDSLLMKVPLLRGNWPEERLDAMSFFFFGDRSGLRLGSPASRALTVSDQWFMNAMGWNEEVPIESVSFEGPDGRRVTYPVKDWHPTRDDGTGTRFSLNATLGDQTRPASAQYRRITARRKPASATDTSSDDTAAGSGPPTAPEPTTWSVWIRLLSSDPKAGDDREVGSLYLDVTIPEHGQEFTLLEFDRAVDIHELVEHLQNNREHYSQAIWRSLDGASLGHLLDGFTVTLDGERRALAQVVDSAPIGVAGNYLLLRMPAAADDDSWQQFLQDKGMHAGSRREDIVPLPTGGVFAEAVLGRSNAAERIDLTRFWNWQDSPSPVTAPEIAAIQSGSRAQSEPGGPGQLGAPVVNIQNAPALPDPQGFVPALQALANGDLFRDMSGLSGTQQLARAYLEEAMRGATEAGRQAGQNLQAAADFASRTAGRGDATASSGRWGGAGTPNTMTGEGGRLNYGRDLDDRLRRQLGGRTASDLGSLDGWPSHEVEQYEAGLGGGGSPEIVTASYGGVGALSSILDDVVLGAAPQAKQPPLVAFDGVAGTSSSRRAYARMVLDDGVAQRALLARYIEDYGFDKTAPQTIRGPAVREPSTGLEPIDFAAIEAVATAMGTSPAQVLALWIYEGKNEHNATIHGGLVDPGFSFPPPLAASLSDRFRPWLRSVILFMAFGSDRLSATTRASADEDSSLQGPDGPHQARFRAGLAQLQGRAVPGVGPWSDAKRAAVEQYFTAPGGAFTAELAPGLGGDVHPRARLATDSLASWLWLQNALFDVYRRELQDWFASTYGSPIDLSTQPWVTYTYWNGGPGTWDWFTGAPSPQDAIDKLFGSPNGPPAKLNADQLDRYYSRGKYAAAGQSLAALANAALVKYLLEAVQSWFT